MSDIPEEEELMKNKTIGIFATLFVIGVISLVAVFAYKGDPDAQGPNYDADVHGQLEAAIEAGDYDAWIKIRQDNNLPMYGRMFQVINKDNFDLYRQMHLAMEEGDTQTADDLRAELGLGQGRVQGRNLAVNTNTATHQGCQQAQTGSCGDSCGMVR